MGFSFSVRGFQSVRKLVHVAVEGYCTIEGESNLGKSALVRAFHAALSNRSGDEFLHDDEASCDVTIESCGHIMGWSKGRKATCYTVDGKEIGKVGRGAVPGEIQALGIYPVRTLDKHDHWVQIHFQWDVPFIIGAYTDTVAAELLSVSTETSKITRAIKLVNGDVSKCKTKVDFLETQYKDIACNVQVMEELAARINAAQKIVDQNEQACNEVARKERAYKGLVLQYHSSWTRWKITHPLKGAVFPVTPDSTRYQALRDLNQRYIQTQTFIELSSRNLDSVPDAPAGRQLVAELSSIYRQYLQISRKVDILRPLVQIKAVQSPDWKTTVDKIRDLGILQGQFLKTQKELEASKRVLGEISQKLKGISEEKRKIDYIIGNLERCPLCAAPMREGKFCIEGVHSS